MRTIFSLIAVAGFLLMLGTAGADCDGKCMENSLPLMDIIVYCLIGLAMMTGGILGVVKSQ